MTDDRSGRRIALAAVAGAQGIKGELRLKLFSATAENLALHDRVFVGGVERRLLSVNHAGKATIARIEGINDRSAAEAQRGTLIEVDRGSLPALQEGEYYHADLLGIAAEDEAGNAVGTVVAVENYGAGDLLEIEVEGGRRSLIPFREGIADLKDGRIILDRDFLA